MTSWGDEDLRCFARMQCYPNPSAMLMRSIIKEVNSGKSAVATAPPVAEGWGNQCRSSTSPLHASISAWLEWLKAVSHTHTPLQHFYKHQHPLLPKMCPLDGSFASWVHLTAGAWGQAMISLGEPQVHGRCVWLWLPGVFTLGWKPQA